jgi:hypothetical protein
MQKKQTRLTGNGDANLVGEHESPTAFEVFLGDEDLGVAEQLGLIFDRKSIEDRQVALEYLAPRLGSGTAAKIGATA